MKLHILLLILFTLSQWHVSNARAVYSGPEVLAGSNSSTAAINSNVTSLRNANEVQNNTIMAGQNPQRNNETAAGTYSVSISQSPVATNILRTKRELEPKLPFDFDTLHTPCDFDQFGARTNLNNYPNSCKWVWNNRYAHEGFFRIFKTYQLEGFFFGQWYDRLKRYETDQHAWL